MEEPYAHLNVTEEDIINEVDSIYNNDADDTMEYFCYIFLILIVSLMKMKKIGNGNHCTTFDNNTEQ